MKFKSYFIDAIDSVLNGAFENVYISNKIDIDFCKREYEIGWASIGSVAPEKAKEVAAELETASMIAEFLNSQNIETVIEEIDDNSRAEFFELKEKFKKALDQLSFIMIYKMTYKKYIVE